MTAKFKIMLAAAILILYACTYYSGYLKGWYAHSEQVNSQANAKQEKAEKAVATGEQKAAAASTEAKVIYRTVYRDVVKYVNDQNRTVCRFDDGAVQLRQRAIDAANNIPGFDESTMQDK